MNNKVTVTGMEVKTKTSSNLYVQTILADATSLPEDSGYKASESQAIKGILEPVSTTTANSSAFFYHTTKTVSTEGKATESGAVYIDYDVTGVTTATNSSAYTDKFSENYDVDKTGANSLISGHNKAVAYVDYVVILKAVNVGAASNIYLDYANLIYNGVGFIGAKSYRLAIFTEKWDGSAFGSMSLLTILAPAEAANFTPGKAVSTTDSLDTVTYGTEAVITPVAANTTEYYRVTARLYLEGEDDTCNNETFMLLTSNWTLELAFSLATSGTGATTISQYESKTVSGVLTYWDGTKKYTSLTDLDSGVATDKVAWDALS